MRNRRFDHVMTTRSTCCSSAKSITRPWNNVITLQHSRISTLEHRYTRVTFVPDLEHFGDVKVSEIILATLRRRVYDVAGCNPDVDVYLNGDLVELNSFGDYAKLFVKDQDDVVTASLGIPGWDVAVSTSSEQQFSHFSFVNNMATHRGGTHVNLIADHIAAPLAKHIARTNPELKITPAQIKAHMFLMVKASVPDPTFDSQSKDMLTTRLRVSSSSPIISPSFVKRIVESTNIVDSVVDMAMAKQRQALYRTARKVTKSKRNLLDVPKLEDAIKAAGPRSHECT